LAYCERLETNEGYSWERKQWQKVTSDPTPNGCAEHQPPGLTSPGNNMVYRRQ
jgi:hypothetical protein